jgi:prepilin-type N-terminal cleavage/methylation domain-containing protein
MDDRHAKQEGLRAVPAGPGRGTPDAPPPRAGQARGFTLIELLVVMGILAVLMAVVLPIIGIAQRQARATATRSVMAKVDVALRLFRADIGSYPWQRTYADLAAGAAWTNRLHYHLGTALEASALDNLRADIATVTTLYNVVPRYNPTTFGTGHAFDARDIDAGGAFGKDSAVMMLNRMALERATVAIFSGNIDIEGPQFPLRAYFPGYQNTAYARRTMPAGKLITPPAASSGSPGWGGDYLAGEIPARNRNGEAILDDWGRPLIYVCQAIEGMTSAPIFKVGLGGAYFLRAADFGMLPAGRTTLGPVDRITGAAIVDHATRLPDVTQLRVSDRRYYAAPKLELEFELWSAGPDGRAAWMRDAADNRDNVPFTPYDRDIP